MATNSTADNPDIFQIRTHAAGPEGALPLTAEMLGGAPSGDLFGLTQNVGMGWDAALANGPQFLVLSTQGGCARRMESRSRSGITRGILKSGCKSRLLHENCGGSDACRLRAR